MTSVVSECSKVVRSDGQGEGDGGEDDEGDDPDEEARHHRDDWLGDQLREGFKNSISAN